MFKVVIFIVTYNNINKYKCNFRSSMSEVQKKDEVAAQKEGTKNIYLNTEYNLTIKISQLI